MDIQLYERITEPAQAARFLPNTPEDVEKFMDWCGGYLPGGQQMNKILWSFRLVDQTVTYGDWVIRFNDAKIVSMQHDDFLRMYRKYENT